MKSLILVAVILQLVIIGIKTQTYEFGDMIEFQRLCGTYSHFAMYVGPQSGVNVGQGDNDIFHLTTTTATVSQVDPGASVEEGIAALMKETGKLGMSTCTFGKLADTKGKSVVTVKNYLDDHYEAEQRSAAKIAERIKQTKGNCQRYGPLNNNCEHLATKMRYGEPTSEQVGTTVECILSAKKGVKELIESTIKRSAENQNIRCPFS